MSTALHKIVKIKKDDLSFSSVVFESEFSKVMNCTNPVLFWGQDGFGRDHICVEGLNAVLLCVLGNSNTFDCMDDMVQYSAIRCINKY